MVIRVRNLIMGLFKASLICGLLLVVLATLQNLGSTKVIGIIHVNGVISESAGERAASGQPVSFLSQFQAASQDRELRALVIRVNSPGGSSAASQELFSSVNKISSSGVPVVVSIGDMAASGGYYLAAAADYILANGSSVTGSIGVIMEFPDYSELYEKLGIEIEIIKAGKFKDAGHRGRELTAEEQDLMNAVVWDSWDQFVRDVSIGRNLPRIEVEKIADGRILTGRQALALGLIDGLGGFNDALLKAEELAGIAGPVTYRSYQSRPSWLERLMGPLYRSADILDLLTSPSPQLLY